MGNKEQIKCKIPLVSEAEKKIPLVVTCEVGNTMFKGFSTITEPNKADPLVTTQNSSLNAKSKAGIYTVTGSVCALSSKVLDEMAEFMFHADLFKCGTCFDDLHNKINQCPLQ